MTVAEYRKDHLFPGAHLSSKMTIARTWMVSSIMFLLSTVPSAR